MDIQTIIVGLIILAACLYAGKILFGKIKSFSSKKSCGGGGGDCGCESSAAAKPKSSFAQIKRC